MRDMDIRVVVIRVFVSVDFYVDNKPKDDDQPGLYDD